MSHSEKQLFIELLILVDTIEVIVLIVQVGRLLDIGTPVLFHIVAQLASVTLLQASVYLFEYFLYLGETPIHPLGSGLYPLGSDLCFSIIFPPPLLRRLGLSPTSDSSA